jgi:hypothetical protein
MKFLRQIVWHMIKLLKKLMIDRTLLFATFRTFFLSTYITLWHIIIQ